MDLQVLLESPDHNMVMSSLDWTPHWNIRTHACIHTTSIAYEGAAIWNSLDNGTRVAEKLSVN